MTTIESNKVDIPCEPNQVLYFLHDLRHYKQLFPADRITDWEADEKHLSFKIQGTTTIDLHLQESENPTQIVLTSGKKSPIDFTLKPVIEERTDGCRCYFLFEGEINPMLKLMVMKPLTNLFNFMASKLEKAITET